MEPTSKPETNFNDDAMTELEAVKFDALYGVEELIETLEKVSAETNRDPAAAAYLFQQRVPELCGEVAAIMLRLRRKAVRP